MAWPPRRRSGPASRPGGALLRFAVRFLISLFPPDFRREFGADMARIVAERWRDARGRRGASLRASLLLDLVRSAGREWASTLPDLIPSGKRRSRVLHNDLTHFVRWLRRSPAFTASALATLAVGIGVATAIFAVFHGVLLRPLPFDEPERLAVITRDGDVSLPDGVDWRERTRTFESIGLFARNWGFDVTGLGDPEPIAVHAVEPEFFTVLGIRPLLGRLFTPAENQVGGAHLLLVTEGYWRARFGGDSAAVGRRITLGGNPTTIIGVLPRTVDLLDDGIAGVVPIAVELPWAPGSRGTNNLDAIGRIRPGIAFDEARRELTAISTALAEEYPRTNRGKIVDPLPMTEFIVADVRPALWVVLIAVTTLLLIGTVNLAGLLLARVTSRERELAVRAALGAGRARIAAQLVAEGLAMGATGGAIGVGVAGVALGVLRQALPDSVPRTGVLELGGPVLGFGVGLALFAGLLCGALPALRAMRGDPLAGLGATGRSTGDRGRHRALRLVIATEIALAVALLSAAGVLTKSFQRLWSEPLGFEPAGVLTAEVGLPDSRYASDFDGQTRAYTQMVDRLEAIPGVTHAAYVTTLPLFRTGAIGNKLLFDGRPDIDPEQPSGARVRPVHGDYFGTMRIPMIRGRAFTGADRADAPAVAIVNEQLARRFWADRDPIGQRIALRDWHEFTDGPVWLTIVGVVADVKALSLAGDDEAAIYIPYEQRQMSWVRFGHLVVRTASAPGGFVAPLKEAIWSVDPLLAIDQLRTLDDQRRASAGRERFLAMVLVLFATAAVLLVIQGLWGIVSYAVAERRREIGVRVALGAMGGDVVRLVAREALVPTAIGAAAGVGMALLGGRFLASALFEVSPTDPGVLAATVGLLALVSAAASALPAWRATRIEPLEVMRN